MPKYYIEHPDISVVIDASNKEEACRKVLHNFPIDINKSHFFFINEYGFGGGQFITESAYDIKYLIE